MTTAPPKDAKPSELLDRNDQHTLRTPSIEFPTLWQYYDDREPIAWVNGERDVYDLLGDFGSASELLRRAEFSEALDDLAHFSGFVVTTTGWAAPLDENGEATGQPSKHADRRRVELRVAVTRSGLASRLCLFDADGNPERTETDEGEAVGSLDQMIRRVASRVFGSEFRAVRS